MCLTRGLGTWDSVPLPSPFSAAPLDPYSVQLQGLGKEVRTEAPERYTEYTQHSCAMCNSTHMAQHLYSSSTTCTLTTGKGARDLGNNPLPSPFSLPPLELGSDPTPGFGKGSRGIGTCYSNTSPQEQEGKENTQHSGRLCAMPPNTAHAAGAGCGKPHPVPCHPSAAR